jgi:hypothetical protein
MDWQSLATLIGLPLLQKDTEIVADEVLKIRYYRVALEFMGKRDLSNVLFLS